MSAAVWVLGALGLLAAPLAPAQVARSPARAAELPPGMRVVVNAAGLQQLELALPAAPAATAPDTAGLRLERSRGGLQQWVRADATALPAMAPADTTTEANAQGLLRLRRLDQGRVVDEPGLDRLDESTPLPRGVRVVTVPRDAQGRPVLPEPLDLTVIYRVAPPAP